MSKNAVCQKKLEFYLTFLLALLKKLESESKSWSKIIQIRLVRTLIVYLIRCD